MQTTELMQLVGISDEKAAALIDSYQPIYDLIGQMREASFAIVVTDESQKELMKEARQKRLAIKETRLRVEKTRKELKDESLREGQAIDRVAKELTRLLAPIEQHLELQEKYAEVKENERKAALRDERMKVLAPLGYSIAAGDPAEMSDVVFSALVTSLNATAEAELMAAEQRRQAETDKAIQAEKDRQELAALRARQEETEKIRREAEAAIQAASKVIAKTESAPAVIRERYIQAIRLIGDGAEYFGGDAERVHEYGRDFERLCAGIKSGRILRFSLKVRTV